MYFFTSFLIKLQKTVVEAFTRIKYSVKYRPLFQRIPICISKWLRYKSRRCFEGSTKSPIWEENLMKMECKQFRRRSYMKLDRFNRRKLVQGETIYCLLILDTDTKYRCFIKSDVNTSDVFIFKDGNRIMEKFQGKLWTRIKIKI